MNKRCSEILANLEKQGKIKVNHDFQFPEPIPLEKKLKDVLEKEVDEKYYLPDNKAKTLKFSDISKTVRSSGPANPSDRTAGVLTEQRLEPRFDGTTNTITTVQKDNYVAIRTANRTGYDLATDGDGIDFAYPESKTRRGRVGHGVSKTIPTSDSQGVLDGMRIRKLTPLSCYRLMGFDDEDFDKAKSAGLSNTQLYKQAGNSIVVNVLEAILTNLLEEKQ